MRKKEPKQDYLHKIEKGVPIPKPTRGRGSKIADFLSMEVGDSIFFKGKKINQISSILYNFKKRNKEYKFKMATVENGVRIWRIAK